MPESYLLIKRALKTIHNHCFNNRDELAKSIICHCIACGQPSVPGQIRKWIIKRQTAVCPHCSMAALIGDAAGYEMTDALLAALQEFWSEQEIVGRDYDYRLLELWPGPDS